MTQNGGQHGQQGDHEFNSEASHTTGGAGPAGNMNGGAGGAGSGTQANGGTPPADAHPLVSVSADVATGNHAVDANAVIAACHQAATISADVSAAHQALDVDASLGTAHQAALVSADVAVGAVDISASLASCHLLDVQVELNFGHDICHV